MPKKASDWEATLSEGQRGPCICLPGLMPALTDQRDQRTRPQWPWGTQD